MCTRRINLTKKEKKDEGGKKQKVTRKRRQFHKFVEKLLSNNDNNSSHSNNDDNLVALTLTGHFFYTEEHMDLPVMEKRSKNKLEDDATQPASRSSTRPGG